MNVIEGDRVIWLKTARGGYGYTFRIPATVVRVNGERATIRVDADLVTRTDYTRLRSVRLDKLRPVAKESA